MIRIVFTREASGTSAFAMFTDRGDDGASPFAFLATSQSELTTAIQDFAIPMNSSGSIKDPPIRARGLWGGTV